MFFWGRKSKFIYFRQIKIKIIHFYIVLFLQISVIRLVDEVRYVNFKPKLDEYINQRFSAALVYG